MLKETKGSYLSHLRHFLCQLQNNGRVKRVGRPWLRLASCIVAGMVVFGSAGCSNDSEPTSANSEVSDMTKDELLDFLVSSEISQEEAVRIIEDAGYEWRVASIDGVPQPTTRDYREDRVTMDIDDGNVVGARWE